ncbi:Vegetative incompatibility protein HET-E-1 [Fusarium oxysporum f. sp. conglutinans]|nr:Vegetative incompatibility protein HET-E-1 [Fusarium oxysporum f. sp. conglutinans]
MASRLGSSDLYTIVWIASLPIERAAATALLHKIHDEPDGFVQHEADNNSYSWGRIGEHNIVIASLQAGVYGTISAATTASDLICSLPHIRFGLLVGIGGGIAKPDEDQDIRLGDIVVSQPDGMTGGVVQYDFGKAKADGCWEQKGSLNKPPPVLLHALASLQARHERMPSRIPGLLETMWNANNRFMAKGKRNYTHPGAENDRLYKPEYSHVGGGTCSKCDSEWEVEREERESTDPEIHYGIIASGDSLIKDAATRDKLSDRQQFLCVEMEAAGLMDKFPCLVIRGICDYADSHKNDRWQRYAAATAAAFAVELLELVPAKQVQATRKVIEAVKSIEDKLDTLSASVQNIDSNIALDRLPDAEGARFNSQAEGHNSTCLANTRVDLLRDLSDWIKNDTSKPILWLNGMAGTGKSTIARTIAKPRAKSCDLGASFFFSREEKQTEKAWLISKAVSKQFAELVEAPLKELAKTPLAFVIDALDECEREDEIKSLIGILSRASSIRQYLRILITSRPDLPIRLGFAKANGTYQALVLHDMPVNTIKHDIMTFLVNEFERIRVDFNDVVPTELELPPEWPGDDVVNKLTMMAIPLFIFAATVCRFVSNYKIDGPSEQLYKYFQLSNNNYGTHLGQTYGPVLRSIVNGVSEEDRRQIVEQTCHIVGSIVILANPLSIIAMSKLLDLPVRVVHSRLNAPHSILNVPPGLHEPVRLLHISLRDYLTDNNQNQTNEFWVDERRIHLGLFKGCLRVMNISLKEDICDLVWPGTQRTEIPSLPVASCISDELQYACRHWAYHFQKIETPLINLDEVFVFLQKHLLHWLEALSLIGRFRESIQVIKILQTVIKNEQNKLHGNLLREIQGFPHMNSTIIDQHPLQLYSSLMFSIPSGSQLDQTFPTRLPPWLLHAPEPNKASDQAQYILEGQRVTSWKYFSFSSYNSLLGSCSYTGEEIHIWRLETGECVRILTNEGGADWSPFKLSHDGMWVAATSKTHPDVGSANWETESVNYEETSDTRSQEEESGTSRREEADTRSQEENDNTGSDKGESDARSNSHRYDRLFLKIWHVDSGEFMGPLAVEYDRQPFQFSPDSKLLVFITDTGSAVVLRLDTAEFARANRLAGCEQITSPALSCRHHDPWIGELSSLYLMEFSPDSSLLTIMSTCTDEYAVWETKTFQCIRCQSMNPFFRTMFNPGSLHYRSVSIAMTRNASIMMAGACSEESNDNMHLEIRWINSAEVISTLDCQERIESTQFSPDHTILVSIGKSRSIRTWRVETGECLTLFENALRLRQISLSPDFTLLTSADITRTISVWANGARAMDQSSRNRSDPIKSVVLSLGRTLAASSSYYGVVRVWDMDTYGCTHEFDDSYQKRTSSDLASLQLFQFTKDGRYLFVSRTTRPYPTIPHASIYYLEGHFRAWDVTTGECIISLQTKIHARSYSKGSPVSVSPDEHWVVSVRDRNVTIIALDTFSVSHELTFTGLVYDAVVSPDSRFLLVLYSETSETQNSAWGFAAHRRQEFFLSKFSIDRGDQLVSIRMPIMTQGILAVSSDAKFLVLRTLEGHRETARAILTGTGESLYEFRLLFTACHASLTQKDSILVLYKGMHLNLRDSSTGLLMRPLEVGTGFIPRQIDFDANIQEVHTNLGTLAVHETFTDEALTLSLDEHLTGYGISRNRSWLLWKRKKVFWLWPELRPTHSDMEPVGHIEVSGSTMIIGTKTGRVLFFKFDVHSLLEMQ